MEKLAIAWGRFVTRNRVLTLIVSLAVAMAAAAGGQFLSFTQ